MEFLEIRFDLESSQLEYHFWHWLLASRRGGRFSFLPWRLVKKVGARQKSLRAPERGADRSVPVATPYSRTTFEFHFVIRIQDVRQRSIFWAIGCVMPLIQSYVDEHSR